LAEVKPLQHTTLYTVIGNSFVYLCMAFAVGCVLLPIAERMMVKSIKKS